MPTKVKDDVVKYEKNPPVEDELQDSPVKAPEKAVVTSEVDGPSDYADYQRYLAWKRSEDAKVAAANAAARPSEYYVWLADGDVLRVKEVDFPVSLSVDHLGHFEKDGHAYKVVAVHPVEDKVG